MTKNTLLYGVTINSLQFMQSNAQVRLNLHNYHLSVEAKKRLVWLYILYYETDNNVTKAAKKISVTREWLSILKNKFDKSGKDPRKLEPN